MPKLASTKNTIKFFVWPPKILYKHCLYFLLGLTMIPKETGNNVFAKFWMDKQRVLWYYLYWLIRKFYQTFFHQLKTMLLVGSVSENFFEICLFLDEQLGA